MKIKVVVTLLINLMFLSGCGGGGGSDDNTVPATASQLSGTWVSNLCEVQSDGSYTKTFATMTGTNIVIGNAVYAGSNCTNEIVHSQPKFHGKFTEGNSVTLPSDISVKEVDLLHPGSNNTLYDVYNLNNGKLVFGDSDADVNYDGSTAEKRPRVLSSTEYYTKINLASLNTELESAWFGNCSDTGNGDYGKVLLTFTGYEMSASATLYNDVNCSESESISTNVEKFKLEIGDTITTPNQSTVIELNTLNQDYSPNSYDIYSIINGRLFVGDDTGTYYNGSTPEQRPLELSASEYYDKTNINNTLSELQGTWGGACDSDGNGGYTRFTVNINNDIVNQAFSAYSDSSCNSLVFSTNSPDFKIVIGNAVTTTSGKSANELNIFTLNDVPEFYDIFSIIDGKFYKGDAESDINYDGSTAAKRPIALDLVNFMTKAM